MSLSGLSARLGVKKGPDVRGLVPAVVQLSVQM